MSGLAESGRRLLLPVVRARAAPRLLEVAQAIMAAEGGSGELLAVVQIPPEREIASSITVARRYRALLQRISALQLTGLGVQVRVADSVPQGVREAVYENGSDLIVVEWPGPNRRRDHDLEELVANPPVDLILVRTDLALPDSVLNPGSVLVPVRGGPSARLALRVAAAVAGPAGRVVAMHVYDPAHHPDRRLRERRAYEALLSELAGQRTVRLEVEAADAAVAIEAEALRHPVTVLGAYAEATGSPVVVRSRLADMVLRLPGTVIVAKSASAARPLADPERAAATYRSHGAVARRVDKWFAENTFHSREFRDIGRLLELKRAQRVSISLGLPTLNEEATIGKIIRVLRDELMLGEPLLDEIVVIDSGSSDRTVAIARDLGVPVVRHDEILPEQGSFAGKGEALWKSLHRLEGDLVVWCDTDISNIHPQFVYGVLGPLLSDPRIGYVKGFYRRPLDFGGELQAAGGGRVTELAARPLLNLFYPELSGLLQPLSGEYAGRREILERLPFFTGYGVEVGHLIDLLEGWGLNTIAQVDLGMRIHRNQSLLDLSKMAFAIMQVALKRLGDRHRIHLLEEINRSMKLIRYNNDRFFLEVQEIADWERPPVAAVPDYLARRLSIVHPFAAIDGQEAAAGEAELSRAGA